MKLYDDTILKVINLINNFQVKDLKIYSTWPIKENNLVFKSDMAYELGGNFKYSGCSTAITKDSNLVSCDRISLIGPNLSEINSDVDYSRITLIKVNKDNLESSDDLFNFVKQIEYVKYHITLDGFMTRVSPILNTETVRVSLDAKAQGISFSDVGAHTINTHHKNKWVDAVWVIYITDTQFDFDKLKTLNDMINNITSTIDHISKRIIMDCDSCNLSSVCSEVEELKKLHFKNKL